MKGRVSLMMILGIGLGTIDPRHRSGAIETVEGITTFTIGEEGTEVGFCLHLQHQRLLLVAGHLISGIGAGHRLEVEHRLKIISVICI